MVEPISKPMEEPARRFKMKDFPVRYNPEKREKKGQR